MQLSWANKLTNFFQAARWGSGMLASTLLMSPGPNPVTVLLCFGLVKLAGPTGPLRSASGALVDGRRSRAGEATMLKIQLQQRSNYWGSDGLTKGKGGVEGRIVKKGVRLRGQRRGQSSYKATSASEEQLVTQFGRIESTGSACLLRCWQDKQTGSRRLTMSGDMTRERSGGPRGSDMAELWTRARKIWRIWRPPPTIVGPGYAAFMHG
jgi:hypothetical protein